MARGLKFRIWKVEELCRVAKTKALISFAVTAKLICVFVSHMQKAVFLRTRLIFIFERKLVITYISLYHVLTFYAINAINFRIRNFDFFFLISAQNTDCRYKIEPLH